MTKRNTQQRRRAIIERLNSAGEVSVEALAEQFATSEVTIRKDLGALESNGLLLRRYGGAVPVPQELIQDPSAEKVSQRKQSIAKAAAQLIRTGLAKDAAARPQTWGEVVAALAASSDDPYVAAARASIQGSDDLQIDAETVTSPSDAGAWVLAWLWVGDGRTGVVPHSAMLEEVLSCARRALGGASGLDAEVRRQLENQAAWLEDLLANSAEEIDAGLPALNLSIAAANGRYAGEGWRLRKDGTQLQVRLPKKA